MKTLFSKIAILFALTVVLVSCSDDDTPVYYPQPVSVPENITLSDGTDAVTYHFEYDGARRVRSFTKTATGNNLAFQLTYNESNQIKTVNISGSSTVAIEYSYTSGRLSSAKVNDVVIPITYDQATGVYTLNELQFSFNAATDLQTIDTATFGYGDKKGAFANANASYHMLAMLEDTPIAYTMTKKPITSINATLFANTYREDGLIETAVVNGAITIQYEYKEVY